MRICFCFCFCSSIKYYILYASKGLENSMNDRFTSVEQPSNWILEMFAVMVSCDANIVFCKQKTFIYEYLERSEIMTIFCLSALSNLVRGELKMGYFCFQNLCNSRNHLKIEITKLEIRVKIYSSGNQNKS